MGVLTRADIRRIEERALAEREQYLSERSRLEHRAGPMVHCQENMARARAASVERNHRIAAWNMNRLFDLMVAHPDWSRRRMAFEMMVPEGSINGWRRSLLQAAPQALSQYTSLHPREK